MTNKSAKDIAFDKERSKFKKQIKELENLNNLQQAEIVILKEDIAKKETDIQSMKDWIERLLEYTEMSKEDMKAVLNKDKNISKATEKLNSLFDTFSQFRF